MKKILVIKHGSLGDVVFSLNSMFAIKNKYLNASIYLLTEKKYVSFLSKTNIFKEIIIDNRKSSLLKSLVNLFDLLRKKFDIIIDLQNSQRTSIYNLFFRVFSKCIICSSRPFSNIRYKIPAQGLESSKTGLSNQMKLLNISVKQDINYDWLKVNLKDKFDKSFVLIIPGVSKGSEYKQWQPEKFVEIAQFCESKNFRVCIVGTKLDLYCAKKIINNCNNVINKIEQSPPEIIYSIALKSSLIFSNDTGPGHIASLSNRNIIWILNNNSISKANIGNRLSNHKIFSDSVKDITSGEVIKYIEKRQLLKNTN